MSKSLVSRAALVSLLVMASALLVACAPASGGAGSSPRSAAESVDVEMAVARGESVATFAGGCFWCVEAPFEKVVGVSEVLSGYTDGPEKNPSYKQVSMGLTGHTEAVQIYFDPTVVSYADLLEIFWRQMDPTDAGGQFVDRGQQYRSGIFVHDAEQRAEATRSRDALAASGRFDDPIVTPITDYEMFWPAEEYHQDYFKKSPEAYDRYRNGSGRDRFLDRVWGEDRHYTPSTPISRTSDEATSALELGLPPAGVAFVKPSAEVLRGTLDELQYSVTQEDATERAFSNEYWDNKAPGLYVDIVSGEPLFSSAHKYASGTGWPSFWQPVFETNIVEEVDQGFFYTAIEVRSKYADSHLGHVFDDGPDPTGLRYCINSAALRFVPLDELEEQGYGELRIPAGLVSN